jgi:hypothetical protein
LIKNFWAKFHFKILTNILSTKDNPFIKAGLRPLAPLPFLSLLQKRKQKKSRFTDASTLSAIMQEYIGKWALK